MILITGLVLSSGCNKEKQETAEIEPICLQRLEAAVGKVRAVSSSLSSGMTAEEVRNKCNDAVAALQDAADLFEAKNQSSQPLGIADLQVLISDWSESLSTAGRGFKEKVKAYETKRQRLASESFNGFQFHSDYGSDDGHWNLKNNNWDQDSTAEMSFYKWQQLNRRFPILRSSYYYRNEHGPVKIPSSLIEKMLAWEIEPWPAGQKKFLDSFLGEEMVPELKYFDDGSSGLIGRIYFCFEDRGPARLDKQLGITRGGLRSCAIHYKSAVLTTGIISVIGEEARKLDLKIKALL